ncbi:MAG TPA: YkvA family protein [Gemmatimonadaceae bacterium]|nr:YkvA family protein [Gemmatimonadaceae bacterium]
MEAQADREAADSGRPARPRSGTRSGTRTGRSQARRGSTRSKGTAERARAESVADDVPSRPRTGARRTLTATMRELPNYLRLLWGLMTDRRVQQVDKLLVAGAIAYILMPLDWIPDFIPFFGEIDDVFVLVLSLQRLVQSAGRKVLLDHWVGDPEALDDLNMTRVVAAAAFFLPRRIRRRLRAIGRV